MLMLADCKCDSSAKPKLATDLEALAKLLTGYGATGVLVERSEQIDETQLLAMTIDQ
jgi:hypothetical protein